MRNHSLRISAPADRRIEVRGVGGLPPSKAHLSRCRWAFVSDEVSLINLESIPSKSQRWTCKEFGQTSERLCHFNL